MKSRKPLVALLSLGSLVIIVLACVPYSLTYVQSAGSGLVSALHTKLPAQRGQTLVQPVSIPAEPLFDVSVWYVAREEEAEKHGILIETLEGRQTWATHNADKTFNPASLMKLATSLAVLRKLGKDFRFETRVIAEGKLDEKKKTLEGSLYIVGHDPTFGDASAAMIARELKARGVERVRDKILVTPGFSFNYNELAEQSAEYAARVMDLKQQETGIAQDGAPRGRQLFALSSYPLREVLLYMNAHSNNFVAERLGEQVGGPAGLEKFLEEELKLPPEQVVVVRASGRESNRMTPRGVLLVLRALVAEAARQGLKIEDLMPVAADDAGTLRRRFAATPLEGAVVGKTGTLTAEVDGGMTSLAGVMYTQKSGPVLFAMLDQGREIGDNRRLEDELLTAVVALHDLPRAPLSEPRKLLPAAELKLSGDD
ncbi:MAG: D-alanyl-D-alanine carboxypeptidase [Pyrinomonadaceae bacterium]